MTGTSVEACLAVDLTGGAPIATGVLARLGITSLPFVARRFPDGESYFRLDGECMDRDCLLIADLSRPDQRLFPMLLAADTLRDLGARRVGLVAPYLAYMRQDARFNKGEGISARPFARLLSTAFDWLITVDPHLHRLKALNQIYTIPQAACSAAPEISAWIQREVEAPLLIGPDAESEQWVAQAAAGLPYLILEKTRHGDSDVEVLTPDLTAHPNRTPVLVDDIISTGHTMAETIRGLLSQGATAPVCIATHAVFADGAHELLHDAGAARVVSTNTLRHPSNAIDVSALLAACIRDNGFV